MRRARRRPAAGSDEHDHHIHHIHDGQGATADFSVSATLSCAFNDANYSKFWPLGHLTFLVDRNVTAVFG